MVPGSAPQLPVFRGAARYSLELDVGLVQEVGVEEPAEEEVQAGGSRGEAQKEGGGGAQSNVGSIQPPCALPCPRISPHSLELGLCRYLTWSFWGLLKDSPQARHQHHLRLRCDPAQLPTSSVGYFMSASIWEQLCTTKA